MKNLVTIQKSYSPNPKPLKKRVLLKVMENELNYIFGALIPNKSKIKFF